MIEKGSKGKLFCGKILFLCMSQFEKFEAIGKRVVITNSRNRKGRLNSAKIRNKRKVLDFLRSTYTFFPNVLKNAEIEMSSVQFPGLKLRIKSPELFKMTTSSISPGYFRTWNVVQQNRVQIRESIISSSYPYVHRTFHYGWRQVQKTIFLFKHDP